MGACLSESQKQKRVEEIKAEYDELRKRNIVALCGLPKSGQSLIMDQTISIFGPDTVGQRLDCIYSKYNFGFNTVNEFCEESFFVKPSNSFKYLNLLHRYRNKTPEELSEIDSTEAVLTAEQLHDALICGYLRDVNVSIDFLKICDTKNIIIVIGSYFSAEMSTPIESFVFGLHSDNVMELWKLDATDIETWNLIYPWIDCLIFVCDISKYDQFDTNDKDKNELQKSLDLFGEIMNRYQRHEKDWRETLYRLWINEHNFDEKLRDNKIPLSVCPVFDDYTSEYGDEDDDGYNYRYHAMEHVKGKFNERIVNPDVLHKLYHDNIQPSNRDSMERIWWDASEVIIRVGLSKRDEERLL